MYLNDELALLGGESVVAQPSTWPERGTEEARLLQEVLADGQWSAHGGTRIARCEERFARLQGLTHVRCVTNGTIALQLACEALDLAPGDEVIVPGLTWQATAGAVLDANAVPVLADVDPRTWCLDPAAVAAAITPRTRAVIAVHLYGMMADLTALSDLTDRHRLTLIEDCAHAHGARWEERGAGAIGALSCFSFQKSKTLTAGEGGCVATADPALADRLATLRDCGRPPCDPPPPGWRPVQGGNHRMTEWQAAVLLGQCDRFPGQRARREKVTELWRGAAEDSGLVRPGALLPSVRRPPGYGFALAYDPTALEGVPVEVFRQALSAELAVPVEGTYRPLDDSPLYTPLSKRRYHLSEEYRRAIDPGRSALPNCHAVYGTSVVVPHPAMLRAGAAEHLPRALDKIRRHAGRLRSAARDTEGSRS